MGTDNRLGDIRLTWEDCVSFQKERLPYAHAQYVIILISDKIMKIVIKKIPFFGKQQIKWN